MKRRAAHGRAQIAGGAANGRKCARWDSAMFGQKSQKPWIRLVRRKASDRPAGNAAARFHGRNDFFHASNRRARDGFAIEFHIETAVPLGGDADRGRVLSRATKKKVAKTVTGGVGAGLFG